MSKKNIGSVHSNQYDNIQIAKMETGTYGIRAIEKITHPAILGQYQGSRLPIEKFSEKINKYPITRHHGLVINTLEIIDPTDDEGYIQSDLKLCWARNPDKDRPENARIHKIAKPELFLIVTVRDILPSDEIIIDSDRYRLRLPNYSKLFCPLY